MYVCVGGFVYSVMYACLLVCLCDSCHVDVCIMLIVTEGREVGHCAGLRSDHIWVTIWISLCQSVLATL